MLKSCLVVALVLVGLCFAAKLNAAESGSEAPAKTTPVKKVLIIGLDGTRLDTLLLADAPRLHQLIADGTLAETRILGTRYRKNDTISGPGWSSNLTGVWADKHGVQDNNVAVNRLKEYPHFFQRLKETRPDAYTISIADWHPIPEFIVSGADFNLNTKQYGSKTYDEADRVTAAVASRLLAVTDPTAMFVYFGNIDHTGHTFGFHPTVPQYKAEIEKVDKLVGEVLDAVKNRQTYKDEDWLVLVTTDHGGKGKGHSNGQQVPEILTGFLIVSGPAAEKGRPADPVFIVDLVPTALAHLGVPIKPEWKLDGHAVGLKELKGTPAE
ncbi:MAG: alkaline phosphatase family protein [Planctomycetia bacterium]|nr:alkaline phosphatase family protein [Planctomycetia bacterium]